MSIRKVSESMKEQNALLVEMSQDNQKNSESLQQSIGDLNAVLAGIHKVLSDQKKEDDTEKSREELQDKDKEEERKSLFSGFLGQREDKGKKDGKGMFGMIGKIFTKALGFLVKSLPLIGLAALFFGDVVTGLLTAAIGDYDQASILKNILAGAFIGSIFGFRTALVGAILGFLFSKETWSGLKDRWDELIASFSEGDWKTILSAMGSLAAALGGIGAAIVGLVATIATVIAPLKAFSLAKKMFSRGTPAPVGGPMGPPLPKGPAPNPGQRQPQPKTQGRMGRALGGLRALGGRALGRVAPAVLMAPMLASGGAKAVKNGATAVAKSAGSVIKSGASVAASAGGSVAKTIGKKAALSTVAKAIPGLGILAGVGFGLNALMKGDPVAAGLHIASGIAGTIPGLGTVASVSLSGAAAARESGMLGGGGKSDIKIEVNGKSESLNEATRERDELVAKTSSNVIMDNSTTNNVSGGGGGGVSISSPITFYDDTDPYLNSGR